MKPIFADFFGMGPPEFIVIATIIAIICGMQFVLSAVVRQKKNFGDPTSNTPRLSTRLAVDAVGIALFFGVCTLLDIDLRVGVAFSSFSFAKLFGFVILYSGCDVLAWCSWRSWKKWRVRRTLPKSAIPPSTE
jgi:hypothetical protein